jgi:hypothetical protein
MNDPIHASIFENDAKTKDHRSTNSMNEISRVVVIVTAEEMGSSDVASVLSFSSQIIKC